MSSKINRRTLLKTGLAAGASSIAAISCSPKKETANKSPTLITNQIKDVTLRFVGTGVCN
jgi:putative spermidine/putrescine transport system substrate-binding protein